MGRAERSRDVRNTILSVSRELFMIQGYKATTIRQITEKAGITIGSLYHFFRDKEDIFLLAALDEFQEFMHVTDRIVGKDSDGILRYAFSIALELKVINFSDAIAEVYLEGYLSWRITKNLMPLLIQGAHALFHTYNQHFTDQDYCMRILAIRGARMNYIIEHLSQRKFTYETKCPFMIETSLSLFNVPRHIISSTISKAMDLANDRRIELYGIRISQEYELCDANSKLT